MIPFAVIELIKEALRLTNNLIEGKPMEQRRAESIIAYNLAWPILKPFLPADSVAQVERLMKGEK